MWDETEGRVMREGALQLIPDNDNRFSQHIFNTN